MNQASSQPDTPFLKASAARERLGVTAKVLYSLIRSGKIAAVDVGTGTTPRYVIANTEIDEFLSRRKVKT